MNWVDGFIAILFFAIFKLTSNRGIIQEITDIVSIFGGFFIASHTYYFLVNFAVKLTHKSVQGVSTFLFIIAFIIFSLVIFALGSYFDLAAKSIIEPKLDKNLGDLLCAFKSFMLVWLFLTLISAIPLSGSFKRDFYTSASVKFYRNYVNPPMDNIISMLSSKSASDMFHKILTKEITFNEDKEDNINYDKF